MVNLAPLHNSDRDQFVRDNQEAFRYGATEEFGLRDAHFGEDGEIISRKTILATGVYPFFDRQSASYPDE